MVEHIKANIAYQISKDVLENRLSKEDGVNKLVSQLAMNRGSAQIIVNQVFPKTQKRRKIYQNPEC
jgi:hypothetical protein